MGRSSLYRDGFGVLVPSCFVGSCGGAPLSHAGPVLRTESTRPDRHGKEPEIFRALRLGAEPKFRMANSLYCLRSSGVGHAVARQVRGRERCHSRRLRRGGSGGRGRQPPP